MRPIAHLRNQSVLYRVVVDVIDVAAEIQIIADRMFPVTSLPQRQLSVGVPLDSGTAAQKTSAETPFDPPPTSRKICIALRQAQDCMQMVRKNDDGVDRKRPLSSRHIEREAKRVDVIDERG